MDSRIKQRVVGGSVLLILAALLLWLLTQNPDAPEPVLDMSMPESPDVEYQLPQSAVSQQTIDDGLRRIEDDREEVVSAVAEPEREAEPPAVREPIPQESAASEPAIEKVEADRSAADDDLQGLAGFAVQVASLSSADSADVLIKDLRNARYRVFVEPHTDEQTGRTFYRVLLGPELRREDAEALLQKVVNDPSLSISSGLIRRFVP